MRTPSPVPLDHFDTVARYAQRPVHELTDDNEATRDSPGDEARHPPGIETDHDARILDEIEASLRALIIADHNEDDEDARLTDVSRMAAEQLAEQQLDDQPAADETASEPQAAERRQPEMPDTHSIAADITTVREAFRDPRTPPWLLARSIEPEPVPRAGGRALAARASDVKRKKSNSLFLRFGLAATGRCGRRRRRGQGHTDAGPGLCSRADRAPVDQRRSRVQRRQGDRRFRHASTACRRSRIARPNRRCASPSRPRTRRRERFRSRPKPSDAFRSRARR